jgi:hypothetical protein
VIGGVGSAIATVAFTESFQFLNPSLVILLQKMQPVVAITLAAIVLALTACSAKEEAAKVPLAKCAEFREEALSGDYNHVIQTAMRWVTVF